MDPILNKFEATHNIETNEWNLQLKNSSFEPFSGIIFSRNANELTFFDKCKLFILTYFSWSYIRIANTNTLLNIQNICKSTGLSSSEIKQSNDWARLPEFLLETDKKINENKKILDVSDVIKKLEHLQKTWTSCRNSQKILKSLKEIKLHGDFSQIENLVIKILSDSCDSNLTKMKRETDNPRLKRICKVAKINSFIEWGKTKDSENKYISLKISIEKLLKLNMPEQAMEAAHFLPYDWARVKISENISEKFLEMEKPENAIKVLSVIPKDNDKDWLLSTLCKKFREKKNLPMALKTIRSMSADAHKDTDYLLVINEYALIEDFVNAHSVAWKLTDSDLLYRVLQGLRLSESNSKNT